MEERNNDTPERDKNSRIVIIALIILIIFVLILVLFLYLVRRPALFGSFAQSGGLTPTTPDSTLITSQDISFDNSYLFASPLRAAVGVERIRITAYILDGQGVGVSGQQVILGGGNSALDIYPINQVTDQSGRAVFDISADSPGLYLIEASVGSKKLNQKVTVTFD